MRAASFACACVRRVMACARSVILCACEGNLPMCARRRLVCVPEQLACARTGSSCVHAGSARAASFACACARCLIACVRWWPGTCRQCGDAVSFACMFTWCRHVVWRGHDRAPNDTMVEIEGSCEVPFLVSCALPARLPPTMENEHHHERGSLHPAGRRMVDVGHLRANILRTIEDELAAWKYLKTKIATKG